MNKEKEVEAYLKNELPEEEKLKYEIAQEQGGAGQSTGRRMEKPVSKRNRQDRRTRGEQT